MKAPCCGLSVEVATPLDHKNPDAQPKDGDVLICFKCFTWLIKTATGLRLFSIEDFMRLPDEELNQVRRMSSLLKQFKKVTSHEG